VKPSRPYFQRGDIKAVVLAAVIVAFSLWVYFKYPDWRSPSGFGPEWQCTASGRAGPDLCVKKPVTDFTKPE
jgi:hypothetical protein